MAARWAADFFIHIMAVVGGILKSSMACLLHSMYYIHSPSTMPSTSSCCFPCHCGSACALLMVLSFHLLIPQVHTHTHASQRRSAREHVQHQQQSQASTSPPHYQSMMRRGRKASTSSSSGGGLGGGGGAGNSLDETGIPNEAVLKSIEQLGYTCAVHQGMYVCT